MGLSQAWGPGFACAESLSLIPDIATGQNPVLSLSLVNEYIEGLSGLPPPPTAGLWGSDTSLGDGTEAGGSVWRRYPQ